MTGAAGGMVGFAGATGVTAGGGMRGVVRGVESGLVGNPGGG